MEQPLVFIHPALKELINQHVEFEETKNKHNVDTTGKKQVVL